MDLVRNGTRCGEVLLAQSHARHPDGARFPTGPVAGSVVVLQQVGRALWGWDSWLLLRRRPRGSPVLEDILGEVFDRTGERPQHDGCRLVRPSC